MKKEPDFLFYTHATSQSGFGHAARCAKIAKVLKRYLPDTVIGFFGEFDTAVKSRISTIFEPQYLTEPAGKVGIYDRMDAPDNPHYWCNDKLEKLNKNCGSVIFLANSPVLPVLPQSITVIGYKLGGNVVSKGNIYWGTKLVPVDFSELKPQKENIKTGKVLLALGGADGISLTKLVVNALNLVDCVNQIDVLLSPVNNLKFEECEAISKKPISFFQNIPDIYQLMSTSEVVVASYGHLGYEVMCLKKPVCLVGQKLFQAEFAEQLAALNYCVNAGWLNELSAEEIGSAIQKTFDLKGELIKNLLPAFDGLGLDRTARIIMSHLKADIC